MSRTVHYDTNGKEIDTEDCINDAPTYAQEQFADIKRREAVDYTSRNQLLTVVAKIMDETDT